MIISKIQANSRNLNKFRVKSSNPTFDNGLITFLTGVWPLVLLMATKKDNQMKKEFGKQIFNIYNRLKAMLNF